MRRQSSMGGRVAIFGAIAAVVVIGAGALVVLRRNNAATDSAASVAATADSTKLAAANAAVSTPTKKRAGGAKGAAIAPPETRRHEPAVTTPIASLPPAASRTPDTSAAARTREACRSPEPDDQKKCFTETVGKGDSVVTGALDALIAALRRQANTAADAPDPPAVTSLRGAQRAWSDERERACQVVSGGLYSGRDRAACFADYSTKRTRELRQKLAAIPGGPE